MAAFEQDLDVYADVLIDKDIQQIKAMKSLSAARTELATARTVSAILLTLAVAGLAAARASV